MPMPKPMTRDLDELDSLVEARLEMGRRKHAKNANIFRRMSNRRPEVRGPDPDVAIENPSDLPS